MYMYTCKKVTSKYHADADQGVEGAAVSSMLPYGGPAEEPPCCKPPQESQQVLPASATTEPVNRRRGYHGPVVEVCAGEGYSV